MQTKKAPQSVTEKQVRAELQDLLERSDEAFDKQRRWNILQRARDKMQLLYNIRNEKGGNRQAGSSLWPLAFAGMIIVAGCIWAASHQEKAYLYCAKCTPSTVVRVLDQFNDFDFRLQFVVDGVAQQPSVWHFCHDVKPLIEIGYLLEKFHFADRGACIEIAPFRTAYVITRNEFGWPQLPENCHQTSSDPVLSRVACRGRPKFQDQKGEKN